MSENRPLIIMAKMPWATIRSNVCALLVREVFQKKQVVCGIIACRMRQLIKITKTLDRNVALDNIFLHLMKIIKIAF